MILKNAIIQVLKEAKEPLNSKEIAKRCINSGLWESNTKTPAASVSSNINTNMDKNGNTSPFTKAGRGLFLLRDIHSTDYSVGNNKLHNKGTSPQIVRKKKMTFVQAGEAILKQFSNGYPMHYRAITEKAMEMELLDTIGETPESTMVAKLGVEIISARRRGEIGRFMRSSAGFYSLVNWRGSALPGQISIHNKEISKKLLTQIKSLKPVQFEKLINESLLEAMGFEPTQDSSDRVIDRRGTLLLDNTIRIKMAVMVKASNNNIQIKTIQRVRGSLSLGAHEQGLIITNSGFSRQAINEAKKSDKLPVALMGGKKVVELLMKYEIGVRGIPHDIFELDGLPAFSDEDSDKK